MSAPEVYSCLKKADISCKNRPKTATGLYIMNKRGLAASLPDRRYFGDISSISQGISRAPYTAPEKL